MNKNIERKQGAVWVEKVIFEFPKQKISLTNKYGDCWELTSISG